MNPMAFASPRTFVLEDYETPWLRLNQEPNLAYDAFTIYRDLGPGRTLAATNRIYRERRSAAIAKLLASPYTAQTAYRQQKEAGNISIPETWPRHYLWERRAQMYDEMLQDAQRKESEAILKEMRERHASLAVTMVEIAEAKMEGVLNNPNAINVMSIDDARKLADTAIKIERQARGEPEIQAPQTNKPNTPAVQAMTQQDEIRMILEDPDMYKRMSSIATQLEQRKMLEQAREVPDGRYETAAALEVESREIGGKAE